VTPYPKEALLARVPYEGDNPDMFVTWALGPIINYRGANTATWKKKESFLKALKDNPLFAGQWRIERHSGYLFGWREYFTFKAFDEIGNPTPIHFRVKEVFGRKALR